MRPCGRKESGRTQFRYTRNKKYFQLTGAAAGLRSADTRVAPPLTQEPGVLGGPRRLFQREGKRIEVRLRRPDGQRGFRQDLMLYRTAQRQRTKVVEILLDIGNAWPRPVRPE